MATITVRNSKSLPITFAQREGDLDDARKAVHAAASISTAKGGMAGALLSIMGRHWESLEAISPMPASVEEAELAVAGGERAFNKATGLPVIRAMVATAYGAELGETAEGELKPYFSKMAQALFWGVSPLDGERLLSWADFTKAIAAKRGKEPGDKAILRGVATFIRTDAQGNVSIPSLEEVRSACGQMDDTMRHALAMVVAGLLTNDEIQQGRNARQGVIQRETAEECGRIVESAE